MTRAEKLHRWRDLRERALLAGNRFAYLVWDTLILAEVDGRPFECAKDWRDVS